MTNDKIGIFGGTFDPVHWGHLLVAESACSQVGLEQVIWVVNSRPHYKQSTPFQHRWEMVRQAIADRHDWEIAPPSDTFMKATYANQTLQALQANYPDGRWYWILGLDTFLTLPRWYHRQEIAPVCEWLVAPRPLVESESPPIQVLCDRVAQQLATESMHVRWQIINLPLVGISASLVRQYCRDRRSIRYFVPEAVRKYIVANQLYV
ncbi:nicotinate (nicotinamide) nucleotide adenylyltransferase [Scytonema millei]|uniref:Probable nicotinate-nucleotide adenylyltransferase n=1 Tax=Scytonema millei VB511283 TaxID=1245923 RepID=A0A9X5I8D1_9CYAN|nr:nicotinate (nicotinamide) nucleotide adenylyltransferase [Scytonema millei]NHC38264.1 nicotinate (nicotinamide) nucleotide adenylyltransferase [Scytonema millei VB511283]